MWEPEDFRKFLMEVGMEFKDTQGLYTSDNAGVLRCLNAFQEYLDVKYEREFDAMQREKHADPDHACCGGACQTSIQENL